MPINTNIQVPFLPQTGITQQILAAIQLANEHHASNVSAQQEQQKIGVQQGQLALNQEAQPSAIEETKARTGLYGTQRQEAQLSIDRQKQAMQMLSPQQAMPQSTSAQPTAPAATPQAAQPSWLPQGTPPQLAPLVQAMLPSNMTDQEKTQVEAGAQPGLMAATQSGDISKYLGSIKDSVESVISNRNTVSRQPENQPLTDTDKSNFNQNTLKSLVNLTVPQKDAFSAQLSSARSVGDLRRIEDRATVEDGKQLTQKINQQNIVANREAVFGQGLQREGITKILDQNQKFGQALTQLNVGLKTIDAAANGDDLATRMVPTMEVLGINMTGGIRRITPSEMQQASIPVGLGDRWNAFVDSRASGKLNAQQVTEGKKLMNDLAGAKYQDYLGQVQGIQEGTGMDPANVHILDKTGHTSTTLAESLKGSSAAPARPKGVPDHATWDPSTRTWNAP